MLKMIDNDLMMLNKYLIFVEELLREDLDYILFATKIFSDITFINCGLNALYEECFMNNSFENENFLKIYFSSIKRFHRILTMILNNYNLLNSIQRDINFIKDIKNNLEKNIENIKNFNERKNLIKKNKECINEEEYTLLLNSIEENQNL